MTPKDYQHLVWNEINWLNVATGIVVAIDPDIGITIVNKDDHNKYLVCVVNPALPRRESTFKTVDDYLKAFDITIAMIEKSYATIDDLQAILKCEGHASWDLVGPTRDNCPFN